MNAAMPDEAGPVGLEPPHTFEAFRARKIEEERLRRLHATEAARLAVGTRHPLPLSRVLCE